METDAQHLHAVLSRRERQIMDTLYQLGRAAAGDLLKALPDEPSDSTVRTQLRVPEAKGHVRHEEIGTKYVNFPVVPKARGPKVGACARDEYVFDGSAEKVVAALLTDAPWLPAPSIARPSTLERRVRAMLNPHVNRHTVSPLRRAAIAALLLAVALPIAAASQAVSTPAGTVTDPTGRPLADAVLRLTTFGKSEEVFETRTDANGAFEFSPVPAGEYMLAVRYPGFSGSRQRIQLKGGATTISLRAQVGTLQETISVRAGVRGGTASDEPRHVESAVVPVAQACTPTSSGGQITPPMKVRDVRPRYKQEWVDAKLEGNILMQAKIGEDGAVNGVDVISPVNADLEDEAIAAVTQWRFTPTYLNCEPIEVKMFVTVSFKLEP